MKFTCKVNPERWERDTPNDPGTTLSSARTKRGKVVWAFPDLYGQLVSVQESSVPDQASLWLGVYNSGPDMDGPKGGRNENLDFRAHITRKMLEQLLPLFHHFVTHGTLPAPGDRVLEEVKVADDLPG